MKTLHRLLALSLIATLAGCAGLSHRKPGKKGAADRAEDEPKVEDMADQSGDVSFQSFIGTLRVAVAARDHAQIASMMTSDFGYRLDPVGEGEGVFQYWDENNLWPELEITINEDFAPKGSFMVAPRQFTDAPDYHGYRAGVRRVGGSWKFAYFVSG